MRHVMGNLLPSSMDCVTLNVMASTAVHSRDPDILLSASACMCVAVQLMRPSNMVDHVADILQLEGRPDRRPVQVSLRICRCYCERAWPA
jgi:hypothetical protein